MRDRSRFIIVIDSVCLLPDGQRFQARVIDQEQAVEELKRDPYWMWRFEGDNVEKRALLDVLSRNAGRSLDPRYRLEDHEFRESLGRMSMGNYEFLLMRDDSTYEFFTRAE